MSHSTNSCTSRDSGSIGIDTAHLLISDFDVDEAAELELRQSANTGTGETADRALYQLGANGPLVEGLRAFGNLDALSVNIYGVQDLRIHATLPRLLDGREGNLIPVQTKEELDTALKEMYDRLEDFGIRANVAEGQITRLDICRNIRTRLRLPEYGPALRRCSFPRTDRQEYADGGFRWANNSRELLLYPKGQKEASDPHIQ